MISLEIHFNSLHSHCVFFFNYSTILLKFIFIFKENHSLTNLSIIQNVFTGWKHLNCCCGSHAVRPQRKYLKKQISHLLPTVRMQQKTNHCLGKRLKNLTIEFLYMAKNFFFRSQINNISLEIKRERSARCGSVRLYGLWSNLGLWKLSLSRAGGGMGWPLERGKLFSWRFS